MAKKYVPVNERKLKRNESYNEEKKLGREVKNIKSDIKVKPPIVIPTFAENYPTIWVSSNPNSESFNDLGSHHDFSLDVNRQYCCGSDSELLVNFILSQTRALKQIYNLIEDIIILASKVHKISFS